MARVFSKEKWLQSANKDRAKGILTQQEIEDAQEIWVNNLDGKTYEDINANGDVCTREDWFVETGGGENE